MDTNITKKLFAGLAFICSVYFVVAWFIRFIQTDSYSYYISMFFTILSFLGITIASLLTMIGKYLKLRKYLLLLSTIIFILVIIATNINFGTPLNHAIYLMLFGTLLLFFVTFFSIDKKYLSLGKFSSITTFGFVFYLVLLEIIAYNSAEAYQYGVLGSLVFTLLYTTLEVYEE